MWKVISDRTLKRWEFIYLSMIAFLPLVVNPLGMGPYEIPKQVFLILGISFAILYFIINSGKKISFQFNKYVFIFVLAWLGSLSISAFFGVAPLESFWGSTNRMQGVFTWILYLSHFFICLQIFKEEQWKKAFFNLIIGVGLILSIYAILQHFRIDPLGISNIDEASGRSFATLGQPNFLGQWLIFPFVALFVKIFNEQKWNSRNILIFLIVVMGAALATTLNRASIIGIALSSILFLIHKFKSKISVKTFIAGGVLFAISISLIIFAGGLRSVNSRLTLIKPVITLARDHLLLGAGPETMYQTYQKVLSKEIYLTENLYDIPDRIHNETLQVLLDQGVIGLVLYLFLIGYLLILFFKKEIFSYEESASYFAVIAYFISIQFSFSIASHETILMAFLAILFSSKLLFSQKTIDLKNIFHQISLKILLLIFCIFYLYNGLTTLIADVYFSKGIDGYFSQNDDSINYFEASISLNPHSRYYLYNASNLLLAKAVGDKSVDLKIEGYLEKLGRVTNYGYNYYLASAGYYSRIKDFKKENESFQKVSGQAPNWPFVWQQWGMNLFEEENYVEAIDKYEKLMSLAPIYWQWSEGLEKRSFEDREKYRLFRKNNDLFYMAMNQLSAAYSKTGAIDKSDNLIRYLK